MQDYLNLAQFGQYLKNNDIEAIRAEQRKNCVTLKQLQSEPVVILGAADEGVRLLEILDAMGASDVTIVDMNPAKKGQCLLGKYLVQPFSDPIVCNAHVILATHRTLNAYKLCQESKARSVTPFLHLQTLYPDTFEPHFFHKNMLEILKSGVDDITQLADTLVDETSVQVLEACLNYRIFGVPTVFDPIVDWQLYEPRAIDLTPFAEVYVDCGSYDGDSVLLHLSRYTERVKQVFAFEPDPSTFERLVANTSESGKVTCINKGVGDKVSTLYFSANKERASLFTDAGEVAVDITNLDTELADATPTLIKMNIEAFEPLALAGAETLIAKETPALAISAYHQPEHIFSLQQQVEAIAPGVYQFYLRQHDGGLVETVLYALPKIKA
ncbi:FkbM family methyltransferase [Pseudoalteromonas rubra]|uniref:FkbM family methyltransferase n=1 Tax=Pseudoalteromonas rubra TaxID=43658 RepID=A0A5S3UX40_9GAMM|nr:FkbM family methyltransferase [Pseudoalteromonas rubra]QPB82644.1 FkbM family methyltransferase [Pseudoalteromonas rubra]